MQERKQNLQPTAICSIRHNDQRYETCGDYRQEFDGIWDITVSQELKQDYQFLVALHEFVELYLVNKKGIKDKDICKFDIAFEKKRKKGNVDEPGDNPKSPYYKEHQIATAIERMACELIRANWQDYENECNNLKQKTTKKSSKSSK